MKKTVLLSAILAFSLFLAGPIQAAGPASAYNGTGNSFSTNIYGPVPSMGNSYGPVTSLGGGYRFSGQNHYNLNTAPPSQNPAFGSYGYGNLYGSPSSLYRHYLRDSYGGAYRRGYLNGFLNGRKARNKLQ